MSSLSIDNSQLALNAFALGATQPISSLQNLSNGLNTTQDTSSPSDTRSADPAASTRISKQAQLVSKLQQLEQQDPAKFKQVVTDIATKLQAAAQNANGNQKTLLTNLAAKFQNAEGGDLSGFQPAAQSANSAAALYQQTAAQTTVAQAAQGSTITSATSGNTHHHHHHGGGQPSNAQSGGLQQTLSGIFAELNGALGASTASSSDTSVSSQTTTQALAA